MVLLAAAVCTKSGKAIISRQFVEMSRSRIEGLLGAFPKLMSTSSSEKQQHTFVETDSVRYVYQPLDRLYMVLITTKASNILEDLETLRLFSKVIPEYCRSVEEAEVASHAFDLLFAFDEIVALGYRESVNLAQIRTFTEMDSHEEKVFLAIRQSQEREAKQKMREKTKEIQRAQADAGKRGGKPTSTSFGSSSFSSMGSRDTPTADTIIPAEEKPKPAPQRATTGRALVLGPKNKDADKFVDQLKSEGQNVISASAPKTMSAVPSNTDKIHLIVEEKLTVCCGRDGDLRNLEVLGMIMLHITDDQFGRIKITLVKDDPRDIGLQTHPNVDKKLFMDQSVIALKNPSKPFPMNSDVGVLKWRFQTTDIKQIPLSITCWPSFSSSGCDVNLEFELMQQHLVLNDVTISIPLPSGAPVVTECGIGDYIHEAKKHQLVWSIPVIDADNSSGGLEFSMANVSANSTGFFPVNVSFTSSTITCNIKVIDVKMYDTDVPVHYSSDCRLVATSYEVV